MQATPPPHAATLRPFLSSAYPAAKARHPGEGRRKWRLRVAERFWALPAEQKRAACTTVPSASVAAAEPDFVADGDPLDGLSADAPGLGIVVRTDYSDEEAWQAFCVKLREGEAEFAQSPEDEPTAGAASQAAQGRSSPPVRHSDAMEEDDKDEDEDEEEEEGPPRIFSVIDAQPADRARLTGISNLAALRMLNDVDVRPAPPPPAGTRRVRPPNRLVDHDGWQETYTGKTLWMYDARSNSDQCVRLVSGHGGPYGTASGDSWRARVSHVCELQVNLALGAMTVDFGGLDRWDHGERVRNMEEAVRPLGPPGLA